jgi:hypothetical protein
MKLWRRFRAGLAEDGLAEEMRQHREIIEERFRAEGLSAAEARNRAAREFGPLATAMEGSRSEWSFV